MATRFSGRLLGVGHWLGRGVRLAAARFPFAAVTIVAVSALCNLAVRSPNFMEESDLAWLLAALATGAAASIGAALVAERRGLSAAPRQALSITKGLVLGGLVWFGNALGIFAPALILASVLLVPIAPFARHVGRADPAFWNFALWSCVGASLAFLSVLLFVLGLSAILEMVRFLFETEISSYAYEHIYVTAFTLVGPLFALGQLPRADAAAPSFPDDDRMARSVRVLFDWVAAPLALATALVLHLYAGKIAFQGALPVGEIGWIVSFYAFLLLSLRVAVAPFVAGGAWPTRVLAKAWWALLVVPLALLAVAVWLRVSAHGWTFDRYYLALGGVAAAACVAAQVVPRLRGSIILLALVPSLALLVSSVGPLGVEAVVSRSQASIIADRFAPDGRLARGSDLSPDELSELRSRLLAMSDVGGLDALIPLVGSPELTAHLRQSSWTGEDGALEALLDTQDYDAADGFDTAFPPALAINAYASAPVDTAGFDRVVPNLTAVVATSAADATVAVPPLHAGVPALRLEGLELVVTIDGTVDRFELLTPLKNLPRGEFADDPSAMAPPSIDLASRDGLRRLRLVPNYLFVDEGWSRVSSLSGSLVYRAADWPAPSLGGERDALGGRGREPAGEPGGAVGEGPR